MTRKTDIIAALSAFVDQRPGFDLDLYDNYQSYRRDYRPVQKALHDFHVLADAVLLRDSITADDIIKASESAFSGRLTISINNSGDDVITVDYCTGQYFPTEYRNAACAVLASTLWGYFREGCETGDEVRKQARIALDRGIVNRWFN